MVVSADVVDVALSGLQVTANGVDISSLLSFSDRTYELTVGYNIQTISVTPVASTLLTVTVNGLTPSPSVPIDLAPGATTTVTVTVTGPRDLFQDYTLHVTRVSLSGLSVSSENLVPVFEAETLQYSVIVDCNVDTITVTPTVLTDHLTVMINETNINSEHPSCDISLSPGTTTTFTVTVSLGDILRTYTITVTIQEDNTPPEWVQIMPSNETVECNNVPEVPPITALDNCDSDVEVIYNEVCTEGDCPYNYTLTRTWTATDDCGNDIQHVQTITVQDTTPPALTVPQAVTIPCGAFTDPSNTNIGQATATDNCDLDPEITYRDIASGTCPSIITRTWSATDDCGNSVSYDQTITVEVVTVEGVPWPNVWVQCKP